MSRSQVITFSWKRYLVDITRVFGLVGKDGFTPDHIVAIARGGLIIGARLSYLFDKPLAVMAAEFWPEGKKADEVTFARHMVFKTETVSGKILLCDDLTETGETLIKSKEYLMKKFPGEISEIRTAVVIHKAWSSFKPDYYGEILEELQDGSRPWILQPQENMEIVLE